MLNNLLSRFLLSLSSCKHSLVIDDQLNILPVSSHALNITAIPPKPAADRVTPKEKELTDLKESLQVGKADILYATDAYNLIT